MNTDKLERGLQLLATLGTRRKTARAVKDTYTEEYLDVTIAALITKLREDTYSFTEQSEELESIIGLLD